MQSLCVRVLMALAVSAAAGVSCGQESRALTTRAGDRTQSILVERGRPRPVIDGVGWVLGIPAKVVFWDSRVDNHDVSYDTQSQALEYLAAHDADDVLIRINQYDPLGEWRRLRENDQMRPGWRYTVGGLYTLGYTVAPGRLFGGDWYNPFTNTVHLYSDVPALAMEQVAYAEDVRRRARPGLYAASHALPFVGLWHETANKQDVYDWVDATGSLAERREARHVLEPRLGSEFGDEIGSVAPGGSLWAVGGALVGHVRGRIKANQLELIPAPPALTSEEPIVRAQHEEEAGSAWRLGRRWFK